MTIQPAECSKFQLMHQSEFGLVGVVDITLKELMHNSKSFGGKAILFLGDFIQILPGVVCYCRACNFLSCIERSLLFPFLKSVTFHNKQGTVGSPASHQCQ